VFFRLLIFFALIVLAYRAAMSWLSRSAFQQDGGTKQNSLRHVDDTMVKDPQCGVYFQQRNGVALTVKGENLYFCSPDCLQRYLAKISDS
jgi:uncharacterized protein